MSHWGGEIRRDAREQGAGVVGDPGQRVKGLADLAVDVRVK